MWPRKLPFNTGGGAVCGLESFHLILLGDTVCGLESFHLILVGGTVCGLGSFHLIMVRGAVCGLESFHLILVEGGSMLGKVSLNISLYIYSSTHAVVKTYRKRYTSMMSP